MRSVLERPNLNHQLDVIHHRQNEGLHSEIGAFDLACEVTAALILLAARMLAAGDVSEVERDQLGDAAPDS
jgi:hypothetical protein